MLKENNNYLKKEKLNDEQVFDNFDYHKYLKDALELNENEVETKVPKIKKALFVDDSPKDYRRQFAYINDERLGQIRLGIVLDDLWKKGKHPSESHAEKHLILFREDYYKQKENPDVCAWLIHELAHCKKLIDSSEEEYEKNIRQRAYDDLVSEYSCSNNVVENYAFGEQFKYLKSRGKTKEEILSSLSRYYNKEDFKFFNKVFETIDKKNIGLEVNKDTVKSGF